jgi:hypothetical protein
MNIVERQLYAAHLKEPKVRLVRDQDAAVFDAAQPVTPEVVWQCLPLPAWWLRLCRVDQPAAQFAPQVFAFVTAGHRAVVWCFDVISWELVPQGSMRMCLQA